MISHTAILVKALRERGGRYEMSGRQHGLECDDDSCDWEIIVGLSRDLDRVIGGTERVGRVSDHSDIVTTAGGRS
jgi:hypothetical protein